LGGVRWWRCGHRPRRYHGTRHGRTHVLTGDFAITVISDGYLTPSVDALARNIEPPRLAAVLGLANASHPVNAPINVTLIKTRSDLVLSRCRAGPNFMPTAGKLGDNLGTLGVDRGR
jgi:hypothetical protein